MLMSTAKTLKLTAKRSVKDLLCYLKIVIINFACIYMCLWLHLCVCCVYVYVCVCLCIYFVFTNFDWYRNKVPDFLGSSKCKNCYGRGIFRAQSNFTKDGAI